MEVDLDAILQKGSSSQLCPFLGVMAMVMAYDHPFRCRILDCLQDVLTKSLWNCSDSEPSSIRERDEVILARPE